ncbi:MAG: PIN domain-containing protein [Chloroflexi bacterium]|nr:PIN domain-containing protein [Chloroflexota bacterium]
MSDDFFDSNVLVYLFDETDPRKFHIARQLIDRAIEAGSAIISFQVVQEVLSLLTNKFATPASPDRAHDVLENVLVPLWRVMPSQNLYDRALAVQSRYQHGFYDSLIVAAALEAGCTRLLSEDLQDGQRIERLTIVDPFASSRGAAP